MHILGSLAKQATGFLTLSSPLLCWQHCRACCKTGYSRESCPSQIATSCERLRSKCHVYNEHWPNIEGLVMQAPSDNFGSASGSFYDDAFGDFCYFEHRDIQETQAEGSDCLLQTPGGRLVASASTRVLVLILASAKSACNKKDYLTILT